MGTSKKIWRWARNLLLVLLALTLLILAGGTGFAWYTVSRNMAVPPPADPAVRLADYLHEPLVPLRPAPDAETFDWAKIADPPVSARPWTRWWWPGAAVDPARLRTELAEMKAANFAGAEVQPFSLGLRDGPGMQSHADEHTQAKMLEFDTPGYHAILRGMLADAEKLGLRIDLTHLSGWPVGGPQVSLEEGLQNLAVASQRFKGGRRVEIGLPRPRPSLNDYLMGGMGLAHFAGGHEKLLSVLVARPLTGELSRNPFDLHDSLRIDPGSVLLVNEKLVDGKLVWDAPEGEWLLVASWLIPEGEEPTLSAYPRPGYVLDVMRRDGVIAHYNYAYGRRTGLAPFYSGVLRGFFNDSLEFKANRLSSADILEEFRKRRGYDLEPYLPVTLVDAIDNFFLRDVLGLDASPPYRISDLDERIRHDYQLTLSDLIVERFLRTSREWAEQRGLASRAQSYGMDLDVIRGLGENTIPETEQLYAGGGDAFLKLASSAAALYGRQLVSAESFVWSGQDYAGYAGKLKAAADKLFAAGINHVVYHGTPYGWRRGEQQPFGEQGWFPWSLGDTHFSDNYSPANPAWADIPLLNRYIARAQNLLRQGKPDIDVLVYYPFLGYPFMGHEKRTPTEPLFYGTFPFSVPTPAMEVPGFLPPRREDERLQWLQKLQPLLDEFDRRGITWGWINGDALRGGALMPEGRFSHGGRYCGLLLAHVEMIPLQDLSAMRPLADSGRLHFFGKKPERQPGFLDARRGDESVRGLTALLSVGRDTAASPAALADVLQANAGAGVAFDNSSRIKRYARILESGGSIQFFANPVEEAQRTSLQIARQTAWWFDPLSGRAWPAESASTLELEPFESRFLILGVPMPAALAAGHATTPSRIIALSRWNLKAAEVELRDTELIDWKEQPLLRSAGGPAVYTTYFDMAPLGEGQRILLKLGLVPGSVRVQVNGRSVEGGSLPPGKLDIGGLLKPGRNELSIRYVPPQRNAFVGRYESGDARYRQFKESKDSVRTSAGLLTPIVLEVHAP